MLLVGYNFWSILSHMPTPIPPALLSLSDIVLAPSAK